MVTLKEIKDFARRTKQSLEKSYEELTGKRFMPKRDIEHRAAASTWTDPFATSAHPIDRQHRRTLAALTGRLEAEARLEKLRRRLRPTKAEQAEDREIARLQRETRRFERIALLGFEE